jgi:hypothetical protein
MMRAMDQLPLLDITAVVDSPAPRAARPTHDGTVGRTDRGARRGRGARVARSSRGQFTLDDHTRAIGLAGVAEARRILAEKARRAAARHAA